MQHFVRAFFFILLFAFSAIPATSMAQLSTDEQELLTVSLSPQFPRPFDTVTASVGSTFINLNSAQITFYIDGVKIDTTDAKRASFRVGGAGTRATLQIEAVVDGQTYTQRLFLYPAEVSLVLESLATTPPFYKGAALVAPEGSVRVVALPALRRLGGELIPTKDLVYSWSQGSKKLMDFSGIGRSVLTATAPVMYRGADVTVTVSDQAGSLVARASIAINPGAPYLRIYPRDPLMGTFYERALGDTYSLSESEESFRAVPYFFDTTPLLVWSVGGQGNSQGQDLTIRRASSGEGRTTLSVTGTSDRSVTSASRSLTVIFDKIKSGNLFGL